MQDIAHIIIYLIFNKKSLTIYSMVKTKDLSFNEPKKLPSLQILSDDFGIEFNTDLQRFQKIE